MALIVLNQLNLYQGFQRNSLTITSFSLSSLFLYVEEWKIEISKEANTTIIVQKHKYTEKRSQMYFASGSSVLCQDCPTNHDTIHLTLIVPY